MTEKERRRLEEKEFEKKVIKIIIISEISSLGIAIFFLSGNFIWVSIQAVIAFLFLSLIGINLYELNGDRKYGFPIWNFLTYFILIISLAFIPEHTSLWYLFMIWYSLCLIYIAKGIRKK